MSKNESPARNSTTNSDIDMPMPRDPGVMVVNEATPLLSGEENGEIMVESSTVEDDSENFRESPSENMDREISVPKVPLRYQRHGILIS